MIFLGSKEGAQAPIAWGSSVWITQRFSQRNCQAVVQMDKAQAVKKKSWGLPLTSKNIKTTFVKLKRKLRLSMIQYKYATLQVDMASSTKIFFNQKRRKKN